LVGGYDSPLLREMASLTSRQALEGQVRLADVLAELGHPIREFDSPYEQLPWRGQWEASGGLSIGWIAPHRPYASAQYVLEIIGDYEGLWEPGGGEALMAMLRAWDENPDLRPAIDELIRGHLRGLREDDVPPLLQPDGQD
jgi:hypothetical protein